MFYIEHFRTQTKNNFLKGKNMKKLIVIAVLMLTQISFAEMQWVKTTSLNRPRTGPAVTVSSDGLIYAVGGVDYGYGHEHATNTAERFNENTRLWTDIAPMSEKRHMAGAVTDSQGRIWVVGGGYMEGGEVGVLSSIERYEPSLNSWTPLLKQLNTPREGHGIAITGDDSIYIYGGWTVTGNLNTVEKYDPILDGWEFVAPMNQARAGHGSAMDEMGRIYAIGGQTETAHLATCERYNPLSNIWEFIADLPEVMANPATFTLDGEIYAVGGWQDAGYTNACYIYSPATNSWRSGP
jgi:N-acetylneuraminic acid mutarotase